MTYEELIDIADRRHPGRGLREAFECGDLTEADPVAVVISREIYAGCSDGQDDKEQLDLIKEYLREIAFELIVVAETFRNMHLELCVADNRCRPAECRKPDAAEIP